MSNVNTALDLNTAALKSLAPIFYPESDGKPMAETPTHVRELTAAFSVLLYHFRDAADVYVGANMMMYYVEGDPHRSVSPDVFVVHQVPKLPERRVYKIWEEGRGPELVIELTSKSTKAQDLKWKWELYQSLGVKEYVLFDPLGEYLDPPVRGYVLQIGRYKPMRQAEDGSLYSEVLDLILRREKDQLRFFDPSSGKRMLTYGEACDTAKAATDLAERSETALAQTESTLAQTESALANSMVARSQVESTLAQTEATLAQTETALAQTETALAQTETALAHSLAARSQAESTLEMEQNARLQMESNLAREQNARLQAETELSRLKALLAGTSLEAGAMPAI